MTTEQQIKKAAEQAKIDMIAALKKAKCPVTPHAFELMAKYKLAALEKDIEVSFDEIAIEIKKKLKEEYKLFLEQIESSGDRNETSN